MERANIFGRLNTIRPKTLHGDLGAEMLSGRRDRLASQEALSAPIVFSE